MAAIGELLALVTGTGTPTRVSSTNNAALTGDLTLTGTQSFIGDVSITGNLNVTGDIISGGTINVTTQDRFLDLAIPNSTTTAKAAGITMNVAALTGSLESGPFTFVAAGANNATFDINNVAASATFEPGDIIQIGGLSDTLSENAGLFVIQAVTDGTDASGAPSASKSQIRVAGAVTAQATNAPWAQNNFTAGTSATGTMSRISLGVYTIGDGIILYNASTAVGVGVFTSGFAGDTAIPASAWVRGTWGTSPVSGASRQELFYANVVGAPTLQQAYDNSSDPATITTAANKELLFSLNATGPFQVAGPGAIEFGTGALADIASFDVTSTGAISLNTTGGAINVGTTNVAQTINIGTAGSRTINVGSVSSTNVVVTSYGNASVTTISGSVVIDGFNGIALNSSNGNLDIGNNADAGSISIGTAGARSSITIGSTAALQATVEADTIDIGTGAQAHAINIGNSAQVQTIAIGDTTGASVVNIEGGSGGINLDTTAGPISLVALHTASEFLLTANSASNATLTFAATNAGAGNAIIDIDATSQINVQTLANGGSINIGTDAFSHTISIGTDGTTAQTINIGSASGASVVNVDAGTGGATIDATGSISIDSTASTSNFSLIHAGAANAVLTIDSQATYGPPYIGQIDIGTSAFAHTVSIATDDTTVQTVYIGSSYSSQANLTLIEGQNARIGVATNASGTIADNTITIDTLAGSGTIDIGAGNLSHYLSLGTGNNDQSIYIGSNNSSNSFILAKGGTKVGLRINSLSGAGVSVRNPDAINSLAAGQVVCLASGVTPSDTATPEVAKADAATGSTTRRFVGVVQSGGIGTTSLGYATSVPGTVAQVAWTANAAGIPAAGDEGKPVFVESSTVDAAGVATMLAPSASGESVMQIGYLASDTASGGLYAVLLAPQFIAQIP